MPVYPHGMFLSGASRDHLMSLRTGASLILPETARKRGTGIPSAEFPGPAAHSPVLVPGNKPPKSIFNTCEVPIKGEGVRRHAEKI